MKKRQITFSFLMLLMGCGFIWPMGVWARTLYFEFGSSGTNPTGSETNPYTTLSEFNSSAAAGDTLFVAGSLTSNLAWTNKDANSGQPTKISQWSGKTQLSINVAAGSGMTISGSDYVQVTGISLNSANTHGLWILNSNNVTITNVTTTSSAGAGMYVENCDGLIVTSATIANAFGAGISVIASSLNGTISDSAITNSGGESIVIAGTPEAVGANTGWTVHQNTIAGAGKEAIKCSDDSNNLTITNNTISGAGRVTASDGISLRACANAVIRGNSVSAGLDDGIVVVNSSGTVIDRNSVSNHGAASKYGVNVPSQTATVTNNLMFNNANGLSIVGSQGVATGITVANNTFYNNSSSSLTFAASGSMTIPSLTIANNIIFPGTSGKAYTLSGTLPTFTSNSDYNLYALTGSAVMSGTEATLDAWKTARSIDANALSSDPLFTNATTPDLTLQPTSPAMDAGHPSTSFATTDHVGKTRPYGPVGRSDIGAYERQTPVSSQVGLSAVPSYDSTNGQTVMLTISDSTNPVTTTYAVTTDGGTTWLNGSGGTTATATYSTSKTWMHRSLTANSAYAYQLRIASANQGTQLALLSAVRVTTASAAPTNVGSTQSRLGQLNLNWDATPGASGYEIQFGKTINADDATIAGIKKTTRTIKALMKGKKYYFKVRAVTSDNVAGPFSPVLAVTLDPMTLGAPLMRADGSSTFLTFFDSKGKKTLSFKPFPSPGFFTTLPLDVDGDGDLEIAVTRYASDSNALVRVFDHRGKMLTSHRTHFQTGKGIQLLMAAQDLNGDGKDELITIPSSGSTELHVDQYDVKKKTWGAMSKKSILKKKTDGVSRLLAGDLNGDGIKEMFIASKKTLEIYQLGVDNVLSKLTSMIIPYDRASLALGDTDGDGDDELAMTSSSATGDSKLRLYTLNAKNKFSLLASTTIDSASSRGVFRLGVGDLNDDEDEEIIVLPSGKRKGSVKVFAYHPKAVKFSKRLSLLTQRLVGSSKDISDRSLLVSDITSTGSEHITISSWTDPTVSMLEMNKKNKLIETIAFDPNSQGGIVLAQ